MDDTLGTIVSNGIAGGLVAYYAWCRYGTPKTNRASTTQFHFFLTRCAYVLSALFLYGVLLNVLTIPGLRDLLFYGGGVPPQGVPANLPVPFLAALIMTALLPNSPILSKVDESLLTFFQRCGSIPAEVFRLSEQLRQASYNLSPKARESVQDFLENSHDLPDALMKELRFGSGTDSARFNLTRNVSTYVLIQQLKAKKEFMSFFTAFHERAVDLDALMDSFLDQAAGFFAFSQSIAPDEQLADLSLRTARSNFKKNCKDVHGKLTLFLAQALLHSSWTRKKLGSYLIMLGMASAQAKAPMPFNTIITAAIIVFGVFGIALWLIPDMMPLSQKTLSLIFVISVNYALAATFAILPKRHWAFADRVEAGERPVVAYLISAILSCASAAFLILVQNFIWEGGIGPGWEKFTQVFPWSFMPGAASFALAAMCDIGIETRAEPWWQRWLEAGLLAALLAAIGYAVFSLIGSAAAEGPDRGYVVAVIAGAIGAVLGYFIPYSYRSGYHGRPLTEVGDTHLAPGVGVGSPT